MTEMGNDWISSCDESSITKSDVARFDHLDGTYAVVRTSDGVCVVMDGLCTHGKAHLAEGFVDGTTIECPKHNGRFNVLTGEPVASPVRVATRVYETRVNNSKIEFRLAK